MHLTARIPKRIPKRRASSPRPRRAEQPARPEPSRATLDARRGPASQDKALYSCMCGYAFTAAVTTSVGCPHCGSEQAW
jgi:hypothetical protein